MNERSIESQPEQENWNNIDTSQEFAENGFYYLKRIKEILPHLDLSNKKVETTKEHLDNIAQALMYGSGDSDWHVGLQQEISNIKALAKSYIDKEDNNYYLNEYLKLILEKEGNVVNHKISQLLSDEVKITFIRPDYFVTENGTIFREDANAFRDSKKVEQLQADIKNPRYSNTTIFNFDEIYADPRGEEMYLEQNNDFLIHAITQGKKSIAEKEKIKNKYLEFMTGELRHVIEKGFNTNLVELSIAEQFYFLDYIQRISYKEGERTRAVAHKYGSNFFKTFLSLEHGGKEMGDKIMILGEKLSKDSAEVLFKTYSDMVDASEDVGVLLSESLGEKATPELITKTKDSLLFAGKNLLEKHANTASTCEREECEDLGQDLVDRLSLAKKSIFAFSYACKTLVESGQFSLEDFNKAKLIYDKSPIAEEIQKQIIAMHAENTKQYPEKLKIVWRKTLKDGLENENPNQMIVSVIYEDDVVATMRVIRQEDGSWYGASFNVNPTVQGSKVGTELLKKVIEDLAQDKPFVADCYSENPMLKTYIEKFGFEITKEIQNYQDTGTLVYQITLFPKNS